jgi:hypothetical protein
MCIHAQQRVRQARLGSGGSDTPVRSLIPSASAGGVRPPATLRRTDAVGSGGESARMRLAKAQAEESLRLAERQREVDAKAAERVLDEQRKVHARVCTQLKQTRVMLLHGSLAAAISRAVLKWSVSSKFRCFQEWRAMPPSSDPSGFRRRPKGAYMAPIAARTPVTPRHKPQPQPQPQPRTQAGSEDEPPPMSLLPPPPPEISVPATRVRRGPPPPPLPLAPTAASAARDTGGTAAKGAESSSSRRLVIATPRSQRLGGSGEASARLPVASRTSTFVTSGGRESALLHATDQSQPSPQMPAPALQRERMVRSTLRATRHGTPPSGTRRRPQPPSRRGTQDPGHDQPPRCTHNSAHEPGDDLVEPHPVEEPATETAQLAPEDEELSCLRQGAAGHHRSHGPCGGLSAASANAASETPGAVATPARATIHAPNTALRTVSWREAPKIDVGPNSAHHTSLSPQGRQPETLTAREDHGHSLNAQVESALKPPPSLQVSASASDVHNQACAAAAEPSRLAAQLSASLAALEAGADFDAVERALAEEAAANAAAEAAAAAIAARWSDD